MQQDVKEFIDYRSRDLDERGRHWVGYYIDELETEGELPTIDQFMQLNSTVARVVKRATRTALVEQLCEWMFNESIDYAVTNDNGHTYTCMLTDSQREVEIDVDSRSIDYKDA